MTDTIAQPLVLTSHLRVDRIEELSIPMFGTDEFFSNFDPVAHDIASLTNAEFDSASSKMVFSSASYLVRVPGLTMVVDTGVGNGRERLRPMFNGLATGWLDRLESLVDLDSVDVVVCTHLHMDHVGWNTRNVGGEWIPTFPNARYLFNQVEVETLATEQVSQSRIRNGDFVADSITPIFDAGLAEVISLPSELGPHVTLEAAPGDTDGHLVVRLSDNGKSVAVITGDVFHHVLQLADPTLDSRFCSSAGDARTTRSRLFEESSDAGTLLLAGHVASHHALRLARVGSGFVPVQDHRMRHEKLRQSAR